MKKMLKTRVRKVQERKAMKKMLKTRVKKEPLKTRRKTHHVGRMAKSMWRTI